MQARGLGRCGEGGKSKCIEETRVDVGVRRGEGRDSIKVPVGVQVR